MLPGAASPLPYLAYEVERLPGRQRQAGKRLVQDFTAKWQQLPKAEQERQALLLLARPKGRFSPHIPANTRLTLEEARETRTNVRNLFVKKHFDPATLEPRLHPSEFKVLCHLLASTGPRGNIVITDAELSTATGLGTDAVQTAVGTLCALGMVNRWRTQVGSAYTVFTTGSLAQDLDSDAPYKAWATANDKAFPEDWATGWMGPGTYAESVWEFKAEEFYSNSGKMRRIARQVYAKAGMRGSVRAVRPRVAQGTTANTKLTPATATPLNATVAKLAALAGHGLETVVTGEEYEALRLLYSGSRRAARVERRDSLLRAKENLLEARRESVWSMRRILRTIVGSALIRIKNKKDGEKSPGRTPVTYCIDCASRMRKTEQALSLTQNRYIPPDGSLQLHRNAYSAVEQDDAPPHRLLELVSPS